MFLLTEIVCVQTNMKLSAVPQIFGAIEGSDPIGFPVGGQTVDVSKRLICCHKPA